MTLRIFFLGSVFFVCVHTRDIMICTPAGISKAHRGKAQRRIVVRPITVREGDVVCKWGAYGIEYKVVVDAFVGVRSDVRIRAVSINALGAPTARDDILPMSMKNWAKHDAATRMHANVAELDAAFYRRSFAIQEYVDAAGGEEASRHALRCARLRSVLSVTHYEGCDKSGRHMARVMHDVPYEMVLTEQAWYDRSSATDDFESRVHHYNLTGIDAELATRWARYALGAGAACDGSHLDAYMATFYTAH